MWPARWHSSCWRRGHLLRRSHSDQPRDPSPCAQHCWLERCRLIARATRHCTRQPTLAVCLKLPRTKCQSSVEDAVLRLARLRLSSSARPLRPAEVLAPLCNCSPSKLKFSWISRTMMAMLAASSMLASCDRWLLHDVNLSCHEASLHWTFACGKSGLLLEMCWSLRGPSW